MKCGQLAAGAPARQEFHNTLAGIQFKQDGMRIAPTSQYDHAAAQQITQKFILPRAAYR
jgi:hypothetical protein